MENTKEILTVSEVAKICSVTRATIWRWIKSGRLRSAATAGGHHRIHVNDLQNLMKENDMQIRTRLDVAGRRILVVDDDPQVRRMLQKAFTVDGYDVEWASDGFEAGIKAVKFRPDLIILDLFMPKMDGFEVCRRLKTDPDTSHMKIVAISGFDTEENRRSIAKLGADIFLPKPLELASIRKAIGLLLSDPAVPKAVPKNE